MSNPESTVDVTALNLRVIDLDSSFFFGVGRDMTDEERAEAEKHERFDNPPMSVLAVTREGYAAVDGKELAELFAGSPEILDALRLLWGFLEDVGKSNPGWMGKLCLQDYGQMNAAYLKTQRVLARFPSPTNLHRIKIRSQGSDPPAFEDVSLKELTARYMRILAVDRKKGYGAASPEGHFQCALLYLATARYQPVPDESGETTAYRIPAWSDFSEKEIARLESESAASEP